MDKYNLKTQFTDEILRESLEIINKRYKPPYSKIELKFILKNSLHINGIPKSVYMKRMDRLIPYKVIGKQEAHLTASQLINKFTTDKTGIQLFGDICLNIRKIIFYSNNDNDLKIWLMDNNKTLILYLTQLQLKNNCIVDLEEACLTISVIIYKFNDVFKFCYKNIISFLIGIIYDCCKSVQKYFTSKYSSSDSGNNSQIHYPQFRFPEIKCYNNLLSYAYYTIAFCCDSYINPDIILYSINKASFLPEISRYYLMTLTRLMVLSIDEDQCKTDKQWIMLPTDVHNLLIKFYMDKNVKIRKLVHDITLHIKKCSVVKLPFITKRIEATMHEMKKIIDTNQLTNESLMKSSNSEMGMWINLLRIENNLHIYDSDISIETDPSNKIKKLTNDIDAESHKNYERNSLVLPDLTSIIELTNINESQKIRKIKKVMNK